MSCDFLETGKPKVYQGVRVKVTVKELLKNRRAHQNKLASEYANTWYQHSASTPRLSLVPEPSTQIWPCEDNSSDYMTECLSLYSDNFSIVQQMEPSAYSGLFNSTNHPWSLGVGMHQDSRDGQTTWSSMDTQTTACTPGNTNSLDIPRLYEYSESVDPTYISLYTNDTQCNNSVYLNCRPTELSPCLHYRGHPDNTIYYGATPNDCYRCQMSTLA